MDYDLQRDAYGNVTNAADAAGNAWTYVHDANSVPRGETWVMAGGTPSVASTTNELFRSVDAFQRPTGYALAVDGVGKGGVGYAYDAENRICGVAATNAAGRSFTVAYTNNAGYNYGYTVTMPNGGVLRRVVERDPFRRGLVTGCSTYYGGMPVDSYAYAYDADGRPVSRNGDVFSYDERDQVTYAAIGSNVFTHTYDGIGNHVLLGMNSETNLVVNNSLNQTTAFGVEEITWNANGGMASDAHWTYAYDAEDRLVSATSRALTNGALRVRNAYDWRSRRISKVVDRYDADAGAWSLTEHRDFVWDNWNIIHETIAIVNGVTTNVSEIQYFWGPDLSNSLQGAGGVGGLLAVSCNGSFFFPVYDNNGNVMKYVDETGMVVAAYVYDDFGRAISQFGSLADVLHHRFSSKYFDVETGLYYYGYRFYSPFLYRWLSRDPVMEDGGNNLYSFVFNSPMDLTDSLGLKISISETPLSVSDNIRSNARAYFIRYSDVTMSCTGLGVLNINGNAGRHIHIVTPDQNVWNVRYSRYDSKWGKDRSNTDEWKATLSHERDHWHSFDAFFSFLRFLNECDGEKLCRQCESMKESLQTQYNVLWSKATNKSTSYDTRGKNSGGVYPR